MIKLKLTILIITIFLAISCDKNDCSEGNITIITDSSSIEMNWVEVEGGSFEMGCTAEQSEVVEYCHHSELPIHTVSLDSYLISKYEVTNEQFVKFLNSTKTDCDGEDLIWLRPSEIKISSEIYNTHDSLKKSPVVYLYWHGAKAFCEWVGGRLPTEAEWEFAARGGNKSKGYIYSGNDDEELVSSYADNWDVNIQAVGMLLPNELGIYNMSGNASEWCNDYYDEFYYAESLEYNPLGPDSGESHVYRRNRVAYRGEHESTFYTSGCRCAKDL